MEIFNCKWCGKVCNSKRGLGSHQYKCKNNPDFEKNINYVREINFGLITGKRFGKWIIIKRVENNISGQRFLCRCDCGFEKIVYRSHLTHGKSNSCRKCSEHKNKNKLSSSTMQRIIYGAKTRGILIDLGDIKEMKEFLYELIKKQKLDVHYLDYI